MPRRPYPTATYLPGSVPSPVPFASVTPLADATTPNLGLVQPEVGASASTWGYKTNNNWNIVDGLLSRAGGTISGVLTVQGAGQNAALLVGANGLGFNNYWPGHAIAFGWSGGSVQWYVDSTYVGAMATTGWVNQQLGNYSTTGWVDGNYVSKWTSSTINGNLAVAGVVEGLAGVYANSSNTCGIFLSGSNSYVMFGTSYGFSLQGSGAQAGVMSYQAGNSFFSWSWNGDYTIPGQGWKPGGGSWAASSDARVKKNVADYTAGLPEICKLRPVSYQYNGLGGTRDDGRSYVGLIAQEARQYMPELVGVRRGKLHQDDPDESDLLTTDTTALLFACVNAIRELAELVQPHGGK